MKRTLLTLILSLLLSTGTSKPASALVFDAGEIGGKTSEIAGDITDEINMTIEQVNKVKQMAVQGYSFDSLLDMAKNYGLNMGMAYLNTLKSQLSFNGIVKDTYAQNKQILSAEKEAFKAAAKNLYTKQIEQINQQTENIALNLTESKQKLKTKKQQEKDAKAAYEQETDPDLKAKKFDEYTQYSSEVQQLTSDVAEMEELKKQQEQQKRTLNNELQIVESNKDEQYQALSKREESMEQEENKLIKIDSSSEEWDEIDEKKYAIDEGLYGLFVNQYFYDVGTMAGADKTAYQSRIDRVTRQRRYLFVNSAAHLLQVSASIRREIPSHYEKNKEIFETLRDGQELAEIQAYSATRVEGIRALLLYAKLLCAKLQYVAARDLLKADAQKTIDGNIEFNLGNYTLKESDVRALMSKYNYNSDGKITKGTYTSESQKTPEFLKGSTSHE